MPTAISLGEPPGTREREIMNTVFVDIARSLDGYTAP
jgi:hypothetical protein